jgi:hypothetical protein
MMWTMGIGDVVDRWMATVSSMPSTNSSTRMSLPYFAASAMRGLGLGGIAHDVTPTLEPSRGGLTTNGALQRWKRRACGNIDDFRARRGHAGGEEAALARFLSKARRLLCNAGAGVGHADVLEDLLELAILAEGAVDHVEREAGAGRKIDPMVPVTSTATASSPSPCSALSTALPEASETSRSDPGPPIRTAIFLDNMNMIVDRD